MIVVARDIWKTHEDAESTIVIPTIGAGCEMSDYQTERTRRIAQFERHLKAMSDRARGGGHGDCYIVFNDCPEKDGGSRALDESKKVAVPQVAEVSGQVGGPGGGPLEESSGFDLPDEGWRGDDSAPRFVQFCFCEEPKLFYMDLPLTTLSRAEAERILRERSGFYYMADRRESPVYSGPSADVFNPLEKIFLYGDESVAAEDMAFVFFDVWKFPVDWRFFVKAEAFSGSTCFEADTPLE